MAGELAAGSVAAVFTRLASEVQLRTPVALTTVAARIARQAQVNASTGRHSYGTPTPAWPGTGPAIISQTLVNSVTFTTPIPVGAGWTARVGPRVGMYPAYAGRRSGTPSSRYGYYLETGLRNGAVYPWLRPALRISHVVVPVTFAAVFAGMRV